MQTCLLHAHSYKCNQRVWFNLINQISDDSGSIYYSNMAHMLGAVWCALGESIILIVLWFVVSWVTWHEHFAKKVHKVIEIQKFGCWQL